MASSNEHKIILVTRPTRVDTLIKRFNSREHAAFYLRHLGQDFTDYGREDDRYAGAVRAAREVLSSLGRLQPVDRSFLPNFVFGPRDLVVVLGQDGLVANTVKYLDGQPVIGVNPDPARWDGRLLPFEVKDLARVVPEVIRGTRIGKPVTMAMACLNTGQRMYAVNDLFIGPQSHTSARYRIQWGGESEVQSSSGIIVSTGLGSTGWMKSVITGAAGIVHRRRSASSRASAAMPTMGSDGEFPWDAGHLCFAVREPFPSKTTQAGLVFGLVTDEKPLEVESMMPESGVIFSDGLESDVIGFHSGVRATIRPADKQGNLIH